MLRSIGPNRLSPLSVRWCLPERVREAGPAVDRLSNAVHRPMRTDAFRLNFGAEPGEVFPSAHHQNAVAGQNFRVSGYVGYQGAVFPHDLQHP